MKLKIYPKSYSWKIGSSKFQATEKVLLWINLIINLEALSPLRYSIICSSDYWIISADSALCVAMAIDDIELARVQLNCNI